MSECEKSGVAADERPASPLEKPRRARRGLAMSLRAMMLVVLLVAVWTGWQVNRARAVRRSVRAIQEYGGSVVFESPFDKSGKWMSRIHPPKWLYHKLGEEFFSSVTSVKIDRKSGKRSLSDVVNFLINFPELRELDIGGVYVIDADIEVIGRMSRLEKLFIAEASETIALSNWQATQGSLAKPTSFTPRGMRHLAKLKKLKSLLLLTRDAIDESVLEELARLPELRSLGLRLVELDDSEAQALGRFRQLDTLMLDVGLNTVIDPEGGRLKRGPKHPLPIASWSEMTSLSLWGVEVNSEEMKAISRLKKLQCLTLANSKIDDAKLAALRDARGLKLLVLFGHSCTPQAIGALKKAVPGLLVVP